jgi:hypothetical protein
MRYRTLQSSQVIATVQKSRQFQFQTPHRLPHHPPQDIVAEKEIKPHAFNASMLKKITGLITRQVFKKVDEFTILNHVRGLELSYVADIQFKGTPEEHYRFLLAIDAHHDPVERPALIASITFKPSQRPAPTCNAIHKE